MRHFSCLADNVDCYNVAPISIGAFATVSQDAYLCAATHDYNDPDFRLYSLPINIGDHAWVCARAVVQPGVTMHEGSVLALGAIATRDLNPWTVYAGVPARALKNRAITKSMTAVEALV